MKTTLEFLSTRCDVTFTAETDAERWALKAMSEYDVTGISPCNKPDREYWSPREEERFEGCLIQLRKKPDPGPEPPKLEEPQP